MRTSRTGMLLSQLIFADGEQHGNNHGWKTDSKPDGRKISYHTAKGENSIDHSQLLRYNHFRSIRPKRQKRLSVEVASPQKNCGKSL